MGTFTALTGEVRALGVSKTIHDTTLLAPVSLEASPGECVLLLDEPEQRLDPDRRAAVAGLIRERTAGGATVVMASHDPALTAALASRVVDLAAA